MQKKNIKENIDPNHGRKWFDRYWKKLLEGGYKLAVTAGNCIGCIGRKVIGTVSNAAKNAISTVLKKIMMMMKKKIKTTKEKVPKKCQKLKRMNKIIKIIQNIESNSDH